MTDVRTELTPGDLYRVLKRRIKVVVAIPVICAVAAALFSLAMKEKYEVEGALEIGRVMDVPLDSPVTVAYRMSAVSTLVPIARSLGLNKKPGQLRGLVTVEPVYILTKERALTRFIRVNVSTDDAGTSAALARALMNSIVAEHYVTYKKAWDLNAAEVKRSDDGIADLERQVVEDRARLDELVRTGRAGQVEIAYFATYIADKETYILRLREKAWDLKQKLYMEVYTRPTRIAVVPTAPQYPTGPHRVRVVALAFFVSLLLTAVTVFIAERLNGGLRGESRNQIGDKEGP